MAALPISHDHHPTPIRSSFPLSPSSFSGSALKKIGGEEGGGSWQKTSPNRPQKIHSTNKPRIQVWRRILKEGTILVTNTMGRGAESKHTRTHSRTRTRTQELFLPTFKSTYIYEPPPQPAVLLGKRGRGKIGEAEARSGRQAVTRPSNNSFFFQLVGFWRSTYVIKSRQLWEDLDTGMLHVICNPGGCENGDCEGKSIKDKRL